MGLFQAAYRTYESQAYHAGVPRAEEREPLTPVSHMIQNAQIEIILTDEGTFQSAASVPKEAGRTVIPVTIESANRTAKSCAHPLCDQLCYLAPYGGEKHKDYLSKLTAWAQSEFSHEKVRAILAYIRGGTIAEDLAASSVISSSGPPGIPDAKYDKQLVRWRVIPTPPGVSSACWEDQSLFGCFQRYYASQCKDSNQDFCMISGQRDMVCDMHPKGVVGANFGAKLISANDSSGFTFRGRFTQADQAESVGYTASQKAHHALRWVASNHGILLGGRTFLCWNPEGAPVPDFAFLGFAGENANDFTSYKRELLRTLGGYGQKLKPEDDVVIAALDAATTGRLSVTYYNELKGSDFLQRVGDWYEECCWNSRYHGIVSPSLRQIVTCAFGTERGDGEGGKGYLEVDDRILRQHAQQLLHCIVDHRPIPQDIVRALTVKSSNPLAYRGAGNRERLLETACAAIRKYRREKKEEWNLTLDTNSTDRSYLFGRLLAVAEQAERSAYSREESRETNAIRMQAVFSQRPLYAWRILREQLNPYLERLSPGLRNYYKRLIDEITDKLPLDTPGLNQKLEDVYLLGYSHQRTALTTKKEANDKEELQDERSETQD